ncbi:MAG: hypothetical protein OXU33_11520 [Gemmatimonadota bacterium]|nr:hypothetical protein [Gemmatimonadota bacterium]MDE3014690.1 hypothetical protein [Gemmatimonadota bacterium]
MITDIDIMRGHFIGHSCFVDRIHSDLLGPTAEMPMLRRTSPEI